MPPPNVLFIMTDQQRPDTLGYRGETPCRTPHIDRLAAEAICYDNTITPSPLCLPSRAALFTGRYPTQNNMMSNATGSLQTCEMLDQFRAGGYQVSYAGKWHMGEDNIAQFTDRHAGDSTAVYSQWCLDQGLIDGWMFNDPATRTNRTPSMSTPKVHCQALPVDKTNEAYVSGLARDMLRSRDRDRPFFQVCSFNGPHPPFMIPEPWFSMYAPEEVPIPANFGPQTGEHPAHTESYCRDLFHDHGTDFDHWRASYAVYWGFVSMIDHFVGQLLEELTAHGVMDNTIVVFTSDHGENLGAHGLWQKMVAFEESLKVPLLIRFPAGKAQRVDTPASLIDVAPTLAAACGLPDRPWEGRDLRATPPNTPDRFAMHQPLGDWMKVTDWRMVQRGDLKYIWHRGMAEELFDLATGAAECHNLVRDPARQAQMHSLRKGLDEFFQRTADPLLSDWRQHLEAVDAAD
ncbi:sulfatase-like hydrolase/transferase [Thalassobius sp. MITS945101]|uniref:sulfatase-like hydrolase/transferase n=1 Tax=Thalassobius sp. MITS945101 TaxID=3096994 RepID=UPI00399AD53A